MAHNSRDTNDNLFEHLTHIWNNTLSEADYQSIFDWEATIKIYKGVTKKPKLFKVFQQVSYETGVYTRISETYLFLFFDNF